MSKHRRTYLVLSQVYVPDPASVGQHMADTAAELARRGHRVVVLTADRGYDDPSARYLQRELCDGVEVRRLRFSSLGKQSLFARVVGGVSFTVQAALQGSLLRRVEAILVSTSPPFAAIAALFISAIRKAAIKFWVMDLNPDQAIALGVVEERSVRARLLDSLNRVVLRHATDVVVLDRFMAERVCRKLDVRDKLAVIPPWPHEEHLEPVPHEANHFRRRHGLGSKFVFMYSGNHSPSNPITTVLRAAERLADDPRVVFMFVGGGLGKKEVDASTSPNIRSLPYQPLSELKYSLSAADVHVVSLGDRMVGVIHPCKVYGAMAVGRPVLFLGPAPSHLADMLSKHGIGWRIAHGDVDGAERLLREIARSDPQDLAAMGVRARVAVTRTFSKARLCGQFCDLLEVGLA